MAKINTVQELINEAVLQFSIAVDGKTVQEIAKEVIEILMLDYDEYAMYHDSTEEILEAQEKNAVIEADIMSIKELVQEKEVAEIIVKTEVMEEKEMKAEVTVNEMSVEEMVKTKELTKDVLRELLKEVGVILSNTTFKATKRPDLINQLYEIMHPVQEEESVAQEEIETIDLTTMTEDELFAELKKVAGSSTKGILIGLIEGFKVQDNNAGQEETVEETTQDNAQEEKKEQPKTAEQPVNTAKAKTDKLFGLLKKYAEDNKRKGYGYTISSYMLQAAILEAGAGIKKFKGHTVTEEEAKMTNTVYKWLKDKGFIKAAVYSVKEDPNVRVYVDGYDGRTSSPKTKMIPIAKSAGYNADKVTSFMVALK